MSIDPLVIALALTLVLGKIRDHSGYISFDEFKTVFSANVGPDAIPFDFDWYVALVLGLHHCFLIFLIATGSNYTSGRKTGHMY